MFGSFESGDTVTDTFMNFSFHGVLLCPQKGKASSKEITWSNQICL